MKQRISRIIAFIMLLFGIGFVILAFNNPQLSWRWDNNISYAIYLAYFICMIILFIISLKRR